MGSVRYSRYPICDASHSRDNAIVYGESGNPRVVTMTRGPGRFAAKTKGSYSVITLTLT